MAFVLMLWALGCADEKSGEYELVIQPLTLTFENTSVGFSATQDLTLLNGGDGDMTIDGLTILTLNGLHNTSLDSFSVEPVSGTVAPGERLEIPVTFTPTAEGQLSLMVDVDGASYRDDDGVELLFPIQLEGWGIAPRVEVTPAEYSCPLDGEAREDFLTVTNHGPGELRFDLDIYGDAFWLDETLTGEVVGPGAARVVRFGCQSTTYDQGGITVRTNAPDASSVVVPLYAETLRLYAELTSHTDGDIIDEGPFTLEARVVATDHHDPDYPFEQMFVYWHSESQGQIGGGLLSEDGTATLDDVALPAGRDILTFVARAPNTDEALAQLSLTVDDPPAVAAYTPADDDWWPDGSPVSLRGQVSDVSDPLDTLTVSWVSDIDGDLGPVAVSDVGRLSLDATLSAGTHTLTLTAINPRGLETSAEHTFSVLDCDDSADSDADGFSIADGDCDDSDAGIYPGADEPFGQRGSCMGTSLITVELAATSRPAVHLLSGGDLNGDGVDDLAIGDRENTSGAAAINAGVAYLLMGSEHGGTVSHESLPSITHKTSNMRFGEAVRVLPDMNGDGLAELAVTAGGSAANQGIVYLFAGREHWETMTDADADRILQGVDARGAFGESLEGGDLNGDGYAELVVGAPEHNGLSSKAGTVFIFEGGTIEGSDVASSAEITIDGVTAAEELGSGLALGDFTGDGALELAIASPGASPPLSADDTGLVTIFTSLSSISTGAALRTDDASLLIYGTQDREWLGGEGGLVNANDVTGNGVHDLLIRSFGSFLPEGPGERYSGRLYLLPGGSNFLAEATIDDDTWGWRETGAFTADTSLVGADLDSDGHFDIVTALDEYAVDDAVGILDGASAEYVSLPDYTESARRLTVNSDQQIVSIAAGGDTNGDGRDDFAAGISDRGDVPRVHLYESGPTCLSSE